jgi:cobalt-zinc-cadmium efflux system membrane fusion protein
MKRKKIPALIGWMLVVLSLFGFITACGSDGNQGESEIEVELPPSLSKEETKSVQYIDLSADQVGQLNIETVQVSQSEFTYQLSLPGKVFPAPENIAIISAPISGRIAKIHMHEGEPVKNGQLLLEIESLEFANLVADFLQASTEEDYAASQYDRIENLVEKQISPYRSLVKAEADLARAKTGIIAATARLLALGVRSSQLDDWLAGAEQRPLLKIYAPIDGVISEHLIDPGQAVDGNQKMLTVIDLNKVLVKGYASPEDGTLMQPGDPVTIGMKDYPDQVLKAKITTINPALDPINKSITTNIVTETPNRWPKPGQNVKIIVNITTPASVIAIPLSAIEYEGDQATVFVQHSTNRYEKRNIEIRRITENAAIIDSGLDMNEKVAVSQIFSLKALGKFEEFAE